MATRGSVGLLLTQLFWGALGGAAVFFVLGAFPSVETASQSAAAVIIGILVMLSV